MLGKEGREAEKLGRVVSSISPLVWSVRMLNI